MVYVKVQSEAIAESRSVLGSSSVNKVGRRLTVSKEGLFRHSNIIGTRSIHKVSWDKFTSNTR